MATQVKVKDAGKVRVLEPDGRIVLGDGDKQIANACKECFAAGRRFIVIDLQHVPYMDSAGLGEVIACKKRGLDRETDVRLAIPPTSSIPVAVQTVLHLAFHPVFEDDTRAIASFGG